MKRMLNRILLSKGTAFEKRAFVKNAVLTI